MDDQLRPEQTLTEVWEASYTRLPWSASSKLHHRSRVSIPNRVIYGVGGQGTTVEEARIDLVLRLAASIVSAQDVVDDVVVRDETLDLLLKVAKAEKRRRGKIEASV
jgi:hypothetical protein